MFFVCEYMEVYMTKWGAFVIGVAVGGITVAAARRAGFKKVCAKLISAGLQLKDDASAFVETVKEDAEDIAAEISTQKSRHPLQKKPLKLKKPKRCKAQSLILCSTYGFFRCSQASGQTTLTFR